MCEVNVTVVWKCPYKDRCTDYGVKCGTCANALKGSYYVPESIPYVPWIYPPYYTGDRW